MTKQDYITEVKQELYARWMRTGETTSMPATDNAILYCKTLGNSVPEAVNYFLDNA